MSSNPFATRSGLATRRARAWTRCCTRSSGRWRRRCARSAATVLARYEHLEHIPKLATEWDVAVRGSMRLATTLTEQRERAFLFRKLATLRADAPIDADVDALRWTGARADFAAWSERLGTPSLHERASALAHARTPR